MEPKELTPEEEQKNKAAMDALNQVMEMQQQKKDNPFIDEATKALFGVVSFTCFNSLANAQEDPKKFIDDFFIHYEKVLRGKLEENVDKMEGLGVFGINVPNLFPSLDKVKEDIDEAVEEAREIYYGTLNGMNNG